MDDATEYEYPPEWTPPWINHEEEPVKVNGRAISSMRSGCPDTNGPREAEDDYPREWRRR